MQVTLVLTGKLAVYLLKCENKYGNRFFPLHPVYDWQAADRGGEFCWLPHHDHDHFDKSLLLL